MWGSISQNLITRRIAEQALSRPNEIAVVRHNEKWSYADLERAATRVADELWSRGVLVESVVALALPRSPEFIVAALAVLKCGAAYLPLDLSYPTERLRFMLKDSAAHLLVTKQDIAGRFSELDIQILALDAEWHAIGQQAVTFADADLTPDHLAYVIYTSGSTGKPKGVEVTHGNLCNLINWHLRAFNLDASARATFQAAVGFDAAVWEIWPHLAIGAALYLPDESTRLSAEALRDWLVTNQITISFVPTVTAEQLIMLPWPEQTALRFLLTGADTLHRYAPPNLPFALINNYGPSECTVVTTSGIVKQNGTPDTLPSIGSPIDNVSIYLLDEHRREVTDGAPGDIYIGGAGVARGYRNRPELTAERFIENPVDGSRGRLYRSGDLGRRLPNGEIAFLGRVDDQVKIRGYRIEPGEVTSVLTQHAGIHASAVVAREDSLGEKRLVAYVVRAPLAPSADEQSLRSLCRERLPDYMEPSAFVWLEALPLTPNGKIDYAALPPPGGHTGDFVHPRTPVEETLADIICEFLKVPRVGVHDDFFELGAHSLLGAQIVARLRKVFHVELQLREVFDASTVAQLSVRIEEALTKTPDALTSQ